MSSNCSFASTGPCTGEPCICLVMPVRGWVYPRMYGGTLHGLPVYGLDAGLSPHVRGNHALGDLQASAKRSIPACTGEPQKPVDTLTQGWVYPRMYGGTVGSFGGNRLHSGLSPHVRGNLAKDGPSSPVQGSIPACTGEPQTLHLRPIPGQVYPRMYGGTALRKGFNGGYRGLSPHVRGNHFGTFQKNQTVRSIPACTGEPKRG